jgi:hypothetical protein
MSFRDTEDFCEEVNGELTETMFRGFERTGCEVGDATYLMDGGETIHVLSGRSQSSFPGPDDDKYFTGDMYSAEPYGGVEFESGRAYHNNNF